MMTTDDVGCTAKSITTCNNLSWSSVSLCQGEEEPRGDYHDRAASFIESSSCLGHMAHSLRSSGSRHLPGSTTYLCRSQSSCLWCPLCWQSGTSLSLDCRVHVTVRVQEAVTVSLKLWESFRRLIVCWCCRKLARTVLMKSVSPNSRKGIYILPSLP